MAWLYTVTQWKDVYSLRGLVNILGASHYYPALRIYICDLDAATGTATMQNIGFFGTFVAELQF
jgi:hypothetical protein